MIEPTVYILVYDTDKMKTEMKLEVVHMVGYPDQPSLNDLNELTEELKTDPELEYLKNINYSMMFVNSGMLMDFLSDGFKNVQIAKDES